MALSLKSFATAALLIIAAVAGVSEAKPSAGCGNAPKLVSSNSVRTALKMTVNGKTREFFVKLPDNYNKDHQYRLIYTLHAWGDNAGQVIAGTNGYLPWYGIPALATDNTSAIYVAPVGINNAWANTGGEDITFFKQMNTALDNDLCIDQNLRFSTGFSYGAGMSYEIACALPKDFRAVAVLSGSPSISGPCAGGKDPIAYYGQHGLGDSVIPISAGRTMRDRFVKNNGCKAQTPVEPASGSGKHVKTAYSGCTAGYPVTWVAFDGGHTQQPKDGGVSKTFSDTETWAFFSQFT